MTLLAICVVIFSAGAQNQTQQVTAIQYFFNYDPGPGISGNGAIIQFTPAASINQTFNVSLPSGSWAGDVDADGVNQLYIRVMDEHGNWSIAEHRSFYIFSAPITQNITAIKYWFLPDGSLGLNESPTVVDIATTSTISQTLAIDVPDTLKEGFYHLFISVKNAAGMWSIAERRNFYVLPNISANITAYQYYFDTDPGTGNPGNGAITNITASATVSHVFDVNVPDTMSDGFHNLYFRTKNAAGNWSIAERKEFVVGECTNTSTDNIISWWAFDNLTPGDNGDSFTDIMGKHNGILVNGAKTTSFFAQFDGIDDYIGIPNDTSLAFGADDFTIEFRANFSSPGGDINSHPSDKLIGQSAGYYNNWTFAYGGGNLFLRVNATNYVVTPFSPTINQWYHLALTRSGDTLRTYIDGQLSGTQIVSNFVIPNINAPLTIGWSDWAQGGDQGFMAGKLSEITVYSRTLTQREINVVADAGLAGKCKRLQIITSVIPTWTCSFGHDLELDIKSAMGVPPLTWSITSGTLPEGVTLDTNGTLSGKPSEAGEFKFIVQVMDAFNNVAQKEFTMKVLISLPDPQFTIFKSGTSAVPGRNMDYFIISKNEGSITASTGVTETLEPWYKFISSIPEIDTSFKLPNVYSSNPLELRPVQVIWDFSLDPGEVTILSYKVQLHPTFPIGETVNGTACNGNAVTQPVQQGACAYSYAQCTVGDPNSPCNQANWNLQACIALGAQCRQQYNNCMGNECSNDSQSSQGPIDPNIKLVLAEKYIKPDKLLPYVIHFENIGTIEAQDVFLTDVLDTNLDISTLNIISSTGSSIDTATRVLHWGLYGINLEPDSSAYVLYSIKPKPGLPSGTVIRNTASIQFEVFTPMSTNETVNIIDYSKPEGVMTPLPDTMHQTAFPISWVGLDSIGEIKSYSIFVSTDSGGYKPYLSNVSDTSAIFIGENGKTYHFICIAKDLAGNIEVQEPVAEATTTLEVLCSNVFYYDADKDGYGKREIRSLSCNQPPGFVTDSTDCNDANANIHPGATELCNGIDANCNGQIDEGCCVMSVNAGADASTLFGYPSGQNIVRTAIISGGTPPYSYSWTLNRPLLCNQITASGDEIFSSGTCTNTTCPTSGTLTGNATCSGNSTITATLIDTANICVTVTDSNGCIATDCFHVNAKDARCFAGNSGIQKVRMCHRTNSQNNTWVQICVDSSAVPALLASGDYIGTCSSFKKSTSIYENDNSEMIDVYPNPADELLNIMVNVQVIDEVLIQIINMQGQVISSLKSKNTGGDSIYNLDLRNLGNGVYIVRITNGNSVFNKRIAILH